MYLWLFFSWCFNLCLTLSLFTQQICSPGGLISRRLTVFYYITIVPMTLHSTLSSICPTQHNTFTLTHSDPVWFRLSSHIIYNTSLKVITCFPAHLYVIMNITLCFNPQPNRSKWLESAYINAGWRKNTQMNCDAAPGEFIAYVKESYWANQKRRAGLYA